MSVEFESWQLKRQLPNTEPYSTHYGINIGCSKCGALVLRDEEIAMIRHGSIWTTSKELEFAQVMYSEEKYDDKKRIHYCDVRCEVCQQMVGMYYLQKPGNSPVDNSPEGHDSSMVKSLFASPSSTHPMGSKESMLSYPCAKILYLRQSASGVIFNKTLLLGEKHSIENAIDLLLQQGKPHNNQEGSGSNSNHSKQHLALLSP